MSRKHTPGPWRVEGHNIRCEPTPDNTGTFVAEMQSSRCPEQCRADALLIAAAPELLEALDYLLEQTVDMDLKYGIELSEGEAEARAMALAAIAKACG